MTDAKRKELVKQCAEKPSQKFIQFDYFWDTLESQVLSHGSSRKKFLCYGAVYDLRNTDCIRLQFPPEIKQSDVLTALARFHRNIKNPKVWNCLLEDAKKLP